MSPGHISADDAARLLGISARHMRRLCMWGRVKGAKRTLTGWEIPMRGGNPTVKRRPGPGRPPLPRP